MKVKALKTDNWLGIEAGKIYNAIPYAFDPYEKVTLFNENDEPICNQYYNEIEVIEKYDKKIGFVRQHTKRR